MISVIAIGKKHETWVEDGINLYEERLKKPYDVAWSLLSHSSLNDAAARQAETDSILAKISSDEYVILLDERGDNVTSEDLARRLDKSFTLSRKVVVVIGGAFGVDDRLHARADFVWSLSNLVFPHQLVRLILTEQIYRAQSISGGHPYHHA